MSSGALEAMLRHGNKNNMDQTIKTRHHQTSSNQTMTLICNWISSNLTSNELL